MKMKASSIAGGALLLTTLSASAAFAATVPSDYARDINDGKAEAAAHADIAAYEKEVTDNENPAQAQVDDGQVQVDQTVGPQEGRMDEKDSGEMQPGSSSIENGNGGASTNVNGTTVMPPATNNAANSAQGGGTNQ